MVSNGREINFVLRGEIVINLSEQQQNFNDNNRQQQSQASVPINLQKVKKGWNCVFCNTTAEGDAEEHGEGAAAAEAGTGDARHAG